MLSTNKAITKQAINEFFCMDTNDSQWDLARKVRTLLARKARKASSCSVKTLYKHIPVSTMARNIHGKKVMEAGYPIPIEIFPIPEMLSPDLSQIDHTCV